MTTILEIKNKVVRICGKYESYILPACKFVLALALFLVINLNIGFHEKLSSIPVTIILALVCCLLPVGITVLAAAVLTLGNLYALSVEVMIIAFMLFLILYLVYYRFTPKDSVVMLLAPICFKCKIPFVIPVGCGLLKKGYSFIAVICGTIIYYFLDGIYQNQKAFLSEGADSHLTLAMNQLISNKEMLAVILIFSIATLVVYFIRRAKIDHAWTIAILVGTLIELAGFFATYLILGLSSKILMLIIGCVISVGISFVLKFIFMDLDYARTENVQFEDDEYYYYVKAVPKKILASQEKTLKRFGNTSSMGRRIDRTSGEDDAPEITTKVIAQELDIDEDLLK